MTARTEKPVVSIRRALVVGYGSIGSRHHRILSEVGLPVAVVSRRILGVPDVFGTIGEAVDAWSPDYVVIATETSAHEKDIADLAALGFKGVVLVEKPIQANPSVFPANNFGACYVGYQLRFHPVLTRLREITSAKIADAVTIYCGQHLADWRPSRDHLASYSAQPGNGGVLRDLSHELDYLLWLFGPWNRITGLSGGNGAIGVESEADVALLLETERCPAVMVRLSYLDRPARRDFAVQIEGQTVVADLLSGTVAIDGRREIFSPQPDDALRAMHRAVLRNDAEQLCTVSEGLAVCSLVDAAERAIKDKKWIAA